MTLELVGDELLPEEDVLLAPAGGYVFGFDGGLRIQARDALFVPSAAAVAVSISISKLTAILVV